MGRAHTVLHELKVECQSSLTDSQTPEPLEKQRATHHNYLQKQHSMASYASIRAHESWRPLKKVTWVNWASAPNTYLVEVKKLSSWYPFSLELIISVARSIWHKPCSVENNNIFLLFVPVLIQLRGVYKKRGLRCSCWVRGSHEAKGRPSEST